MADVKWIKIVTDIFDDEKMYAIETMQDGLIMELIWFKLLCLAGKCRNRIYNIRRRRRKIHLDCEGCKFIKYKVIRRNKMLNKEKDAKEIIEIATKSHSIAKVNGKLCQCAGTSCEDCDFDAAKNNGLDCDLVIQEWANSEYIERIDWDKVKDGTPIWVRVSEDDAWVERIFAFERNGKAVCYALYDEDNICPSYTTWRYARLDNPYEEQKK